MKEWKEEMEGGRGREGRKEEERENTVIQGTNFNCSHLPASSCISSYQRCLSW